MVKNKWGLELKPHTICAIDASTNSLAFALFVDNQLESIGKIHFDGNNIYENIFNGTYTTHDGIKITSKEFFSSDGIHPSVIGQVVIANESITAINKYYGLEIPLLSTRDFLK